MTFIKKIFGNPCENNGTFNSKFARFAYYFFIVFYIMILFMSLIIIFFKLEFLPFIIIILLLLLILIKWFYSFILKINNLNREKK